MSVFLHGSGGTANPPTLSLDGVAPTATTAKYKDSPSIKFASGNPWTTVGNWTAAPSATSGSLSALGDVQMWLGLKNSDDIGTRFDVRVEAYQNGTLVASGESFCIQGITRNPNLAKEIAVSFAPFAAALFNGTTDVLSLKVLTRIGTDGTGAFCGGHSNAVGLRLYFDAVSRAATFEASFTSVFIVGPSGGTITAAGGSVVLVVPEGAVASTIGLTVQEAADVPPDPGLVSGTAFDFGPTGTTFAQPVTVTIAYLPANIPAGVGEASLRLHTLVGNQWELVPGSTVNTDDNTVSGSVTHFTVFALVSTTATGGAFAYVTVPGQSFVLVIQTSTNTVVDTVPIRARFVAITPDGAFAYVTGNDPQFANNVWVIQASTNTVTATVPVGEIPFGVAITPDGAFAYVSNARSNTVSVIQTSTNTVTATVPVGGNPRGVAITPDGAFAYVGNAVSGDVSVIQISTNTVIATVTTVPDSTEFGGPFGVAITPNGAYAYVVNDFDFPGFVSVIETSTNTVTATIRVRDEAHCVAITPDGDFAYVTYNDGLSVIQTATNTVVADVSTDGNAFCVAITP